MARVIPANLGVASCAEDEPSIEEVESREVLPAISSSLRRSGKQQHFQPLKVSSDLVLFLFKLHCIVRVYGKPESPAGSIGGYYRGGIVRWQ